MNITFRTHLTEPDIEPIKEILKSTGFFYDYEIDVALELAALNVQKGEQESGYYFILAETDGKVTGYSCFGQTPCTRASYDLYWIAVHQQFKNKGIGKMLLAETEKAIKTAGGENIWVETASREQYTPTRKFYEHTGYHKAAELPDFYAPADNKVVYMKKV